VNLCSLFLQADFGLRSEKIGTEADDLKVCGIDPRQSLKQNQRRALIGAEAFFRPSPLGVLSKGNDVQVFSVEGLASQVTEARAVLIGRMKEQGNRGETRREHQALIAAVQRRISALRRSAMFLNLQAPLIGGGQEQVPEILIERARDLPVLAQPLLVDLLE